MVTVKLLLLNSNSNTNLARNWVNEQKAGAGRESGASLVYMNKQFLIFGSILGGAGLSALMVAWLALGHPAGNSGKVSPGGSITVSPRPAQLSKAENSISAPGILDTAHPQSSGLPQAVAAPGTGWNTTASPSGSSLSPQVVSSLKSPTSGGGVQASNYQGPQHATSQEIPSSGSPRLPVAGLTGTAAATTPATQTIEVPPAGTVPAALAEPGATSPLDPISQKEADAIANNFLNNVQKAVASGQPQSQAWKTQQQIADEAYKARFGQDAFLTANLQAYLQAQSAPAKP